jgi:hypothetical protein
MKKRVIKYSYFVAVLALISFGFSDKKSIKIHPSFIVTDPVEADFPQHYASANQDFVLKIPFYGKSFNAFKERLAFKESGGRYNVVNPYGYMGKYQFGASTLKMLGVHDTVTFLKTPVLQEIVFEKYIAKNKWILRRDIAKYDGKIINGDLVTESGILAAAHLAGAGNVKNYLRSNGQVRFSDANGASIKYYIHKFSGYNLSMIKEDKYARL